MSTVSDVLDRIYREYLSKPDDSPMSSTITSDLPETASNVVWSLSGLAPEETQKIAPGIILEVGRELMRATVVTTTNQATVLRGYLGTTPTTHTAGAVINFDPTFPRQTTFDAVADAVVGLYPELYRIVTTRVRAPAVGWVAVPSDAVTALRYRYSYEGEWIDGGVRLDTDFPPSPTGAAVQVFGDAKGTDGYFTYGASFSRPIAEDQELTETLGVDDLGLQPTWEKLVVIRAMASVMSSVDIDQLTQEYITEAAQLQGVPLGTAPRLRDSFLSYYQYLVRVERRGLFRRYPPPVVFDGVTYAN